MEITPTRTRRTRGRRTAVRAAAFVVLGLALLFVVPASLGLERQVVRDDGLADSVPPGSVAYSHTVPTAVLEEGDVISFVPPSLSPTAEPVIRRVVEVDSLSLRTGADGQPPDPWMLRPDDSRVSEVVLQVPYVGLPFVERWLLAPLAVALTGAAALLLAVRRRVERATVMVPQPRGGHERAELGREAVLTRR